MGQVWTGVLAGKSYDSGGFGWSWGFALGKAEKRNRMVKLGLLQESVRVAVDRVNIFLYQLFFCI
jgi:hypothetical protein